MSAPAVNPPRSPRAAASETPAPASATNQPIPTMGLLSGFSGNRRVPPAVNEPVRSYAPGSPEKTALKARLASMASERIEIPVIIGGKEYRSGEMAQAVMPHAHSTCSPTGTRPPTSTCGSRSTRRARRAREWANWPWEDRAAVFLRAAELLATTWRSTLNAATMLGQSKTAYQAEIDSACELIDFCRFNCAFAQELYDEQPQSTHMFWNQLDYRALEGFVYAVTPFNFTAIGGQPADGARAHGQHRRLEACIDRRCCRATT